MDRNDQARNHVPSAHYSLLAALLTETEYLSGLVKLYPSVLTQVSLHNFGVDSLRMEADR